jgi:hypothetical protein
MEGQQGAVAECAHELEVLCPCFGVAFPNPTDIAILTAGGTICEPSREIRNVTVDAYCHAFIIQRSAFAADPGSPPSAGPLGNRRFFRRWTLALEPIRRLLAPHVIRLLRVREREILFERVDDQGTYSSARSIFTLRFYQRRNVISIAQGIR